MTDTGSLPENDSKTKGNILIVDDSPANLRLLSKILSENGYKVRPAPNGTLALQSVHSTPPDIVLLDIKMPGMDGYEVCRRLKADKRTRDVPVLFISALTDVMDKIKGFSVGGVDYITKPFQHEEVLARVKTHVSLARMHHRLEQMVKERTLELTVANEQLKNEIQDRTLVEETLRESENRYRELADSLPQVVFEMDTTGIITFVNQNAFDISGYNQNDLAKGLNAFQLLIPEDRDRAMVNMQRVLNGEIYGSEYTALKKDGSTFPVLVLTNPARRDNKTIGIRGIIIDLTERKQAEEEQKRLISAINQAAESIVITDTKAAIIYVNPAFERLTGYAQEVAIGQNPRILKSGKHDDAFYREMWNTLTRGKTWRGEIINKRKDGTLFTEKATISPVFDSGDKIINYIAVKHDVTEQRFLEEQLIQAQKMETVGQLAGGVAHDFNNMLSVILGYTGLIMRKIDPHDPMLIDLLEIKKAAEHSSDITSQLLAFSRKQLIEPKVINLNPLVAEMGKMLGRLLGKYIELLFMPAKELWTIKADQGQINQIVANLGVNARDAMPEGGKLIIETANVILDETYCQGHAGFFPGRFVMLAVSDNGIGMDKETLSHIFEPFFTTKKQGQGTGLGLATIYGIIKQNNGFINVYSELGHGTTFKIYFPPCEGEEERAEIAVEAPPKSLESGTILLVEDDEMVRSLTRKILEILGHTVLVAKTPNDALELCEKSDMDIDLLLTDVIMPQMSGKELKKSIEAIKPEIKTLFMSGYTTNVIAQHGVLDKGMKLVKKPFTEDELGRKVREVIEQ